MKKRYITTACLFLSIILLAILSLITSFASNNTIARFNIAKSEESKKFNDEKKEHKSTQQQLIQDSISQNKIYESDLANEQLEDIYVNPNEDTKANDNIKESEEQKETTVDTVSKENSTENKSENVDSSSETTTSSPNYTNNSQNAKSNNTTNTNNNNSVNNNSNTGITNNSSVSSRPSDNNTNPYGCSDIEYQVFKKINEYRQQNGLSALTWSNELYRAAKVRSKELTMNLSHTRPDGSSCFTASPIMSRENIAWGYTTADEVYEAWVNSSGHRENILAPDNGTGAVALYTHNTSYIYYWTNLFGL